MPTSPTNTNPDHQRQPILPFDNLGMNLSLPVDRIPPGKHRILENVRPYGRGKTQGRQGQADLSQQLAGGVCHSLYSWNDPVPSPTEFPTAYSTHARFAGVGANLYGAEQKNGINNFAWLVDTGFSGNPLSFVTVPSDFTPRPWVLIGDSAKMRKDSSETTQGISQIGIAPPNVVPQIFINAANPDGPDIGATGIPYTYAFRARDDSKIFTGAISDLGPAVRDINGLSPSSAAGSPTPPSNIEVLLPSAHPDPQVLWIDVFRFGGSIAAWTYIGTMPNIAGATMIDTFDDLSLASGDTVQYGDNPQPFVTVDNSKNGTCTLTALGAGLGATLTVTAGDQLRPYAPTVDAPYYPLGTQVSVAGTLFTFARSPDSATSVELLEDPPAGMTGGDFQINSPEMWKQPLPCLWGPYGGGETGIFVFACADALNSGNLYWTKGNHPENHPAGNVLTIASGSETMMNGCIYGGEPYVFSTNRLFRIYPTLGQVTDFIAIEVPNSKGLFARWGLAVTPQGIAFIAKDGIYLSAGGSPTSLTDADLYPIFPHEGTGANLSAFPTIDGLTGTSFSPPDFSKPDNMRLAYGDGFLQFTYIDQTATYRTLVYDFFSQGWISRDTFVQHPVACYFFEVSQDSAVPARTFSQFLMGTADGLVTNFSGGTDFGFAISGHIRTGSFDKGDPRPRDLWSDIEMDLDTECDSIVVEVGMDNFSYFTNFTSTGLNLTGRRRVLLDLNSGQGQYGYNLGLDIQWSTTGGAIPLFYFWAPSWLPKPELSALRFTGFDDLGYPGAKFIQGFKLRADTLNIARVVQVLDDFNAPHPFTPATIQHPREQTIAYSFDTPFISHLVRFAPQDAAFWRIEGVEWIWEPAPELVTTWQTQETTLDFPLWFHHRDIYLPIISTDLVTLAVNTIENPTGPFTYSRPSTGGLYDRGYFPVQPMKALAVSYRATSPAGFRVFQKDMVVNAKAWGSGAFIPKQPFGDLSRMNGARI